MSDEQNIYGAMPPHWLDPTFQQGAGDFNRTWRYLTQNRRFAAAVYHASQAYQERQREFEANPMLRSGTPDQAARARFLHELAQDDQDRTAYGVEPPV